MSRSLVFCCVVWLWSVSTACAGGEWFALTDFNGYWSSNPDHAVMKALEKHVEKTREFKSVAFTPEGDWIILMGANGVWTSNPNLPAVKKLLEWQKGGQTLTCVAFTPINGWVVLGDRNSYQFSGIPHDAGKKIQELAKGGHNLRSIAFLPNGGWVLLVNDNGLFYSPNIPHDLRTVLDRAFKKGIGLRCVASTTFGDWFVLTDHEYWASDPNHPAARQLATQGKAGRSLKWLSVAPEDPATIRFRLDVKPMQRVKAELRYDAFADGKVEEYVIFAPRAPVLPGQQDVRTTFSPEGKLVRENGPLQRPLTLKRITDGRQEVRTVLTIEATLMSRRLRPLHAEEKAPRVGDLSPAEVKVFTLSSETGQPNPKPFREWMKRVGLKRKDGESDLTFAYRAFRYIKHHFRYECPTGDQSASAVCQTGKSDCMGLSNLFTWVMRDNGVPARRLIGRLASSGKMYDGKITKANDGKQHVKAEFFARGIGWVPVELSGAVSDANAGDFAFFGNDPGEFITMAHDPEGAIDTFLAGKKHGVACQEIACWWRSSNRARKVRFESTWTVKKEPKADLFPK